MHKLGLFMCCRKLYMLLSWSLFISFWDTLIASYSLYSLCVQILIYCQHILWFTMRMQYKWAELSVYALQRSIASLLKPSLRSYIHTILLHHISTKLENWFVFGAFYSDAKLISRRQKLPGKIPTHLLRTCFDRRDNRRTLYWTSGTSADGRLALCVIPRWPLALRPTWRLDGRIITWGNAGACMEVSASYTRRILSQINPCWHEYRWLRSRRISRRARLHQRHNNLYCVTVIPPIRTHHLRLIDRPYNNLWTW